jgi:hypothetical protein
MSNVLQLLDAPPDDTFLKDNLKSVKAQMEQIPEGKTGALVIATDWKWGVVPTLKTGVAVRVGKGWEIHGEGFINKADKGATVRVVKTW